MNVVVLYLLRHPPATSKYFFLTSRCRPPDETMKRQSPETEFDIAQTKLALLENDGYARKHSP
jgi:hypothetical protein